MWVCAIIVANHHRHNCPIRIYKPSALLEKADDPEQNTETEENYDVQKGNRMVFSQFAYPKTPLVQDLVLFFIASIATKVEKGEIEKDSR